MKKELILMVLMFGILVGITAMVSALPICTDSDGGKDYNVQGTADNTYTDWCYDFNTLGEYFCNGLNRSSEYYNCPGGSCVNGACPIYSCTDSDGGKDYQTKGEVTQTPGMTVADLCHDSNLLIEGYCNANQNYASQNYNCPNGCSNGKCVSGVGPAEASAGSVAKVGTRTSSTGTKTSTSSAKKSSGSKTCPATMTDTTDVNGVPCCIPKSKTTGRFLGFMFRD